jgi:very-short-patch-repair endonuclease
MLRQKQTLAETIVWNRLRARRFHGLIFRRQERIGQYIADFCCHKHHLIIELDGWVHQFKIERDQKRSLYLCTQGYRILRYTNTYIFEHLDTALEQIAYVIGIPNQKIPLAPRNHKLLPSPAKRERARERVDSN